MPVKQIKSLVQFTRGTSLVWDALDTTLPDGVIVFSIDDGIFKLGDGVNNYQNLPTLFTYGQLVSAQGGSSNSFIDPLVEQNGEIVTVALVDGNLRYTASGVTLASVLADIDALEAENTVQDAAIAVLLAKVLKIDVSITTGPDDNLVTISGGKYVDSNESVASIIASAEAANTTVPGPHLEEPIFYTTADKQVIVSKLVLTDDSTVYCDVVGFHDGTSSPVFDLTTDSPNVTIANVAGSLFSVAFAGITDVGDTTPIILVASVDDGTGNSKVEKAIAAQISYPEILVSIYGRVSHDYFYESAIDSQGNIICVGYSTGIVGQHYVLVVKFDHRLNILAKIYYHRSTGHCRGYGIIVDSNDNIFCCGNTNSTGIGGYDAWVAKFDTNLNLLANKTCGTIGTDIFNYMTIDSNDNVLVVGYLNNGTYSAAYIVKFNNNLNEIASRIYPCDLNSCLYGVVVHTDGNIFVAGYDYSGSKNIVMKLSSDLTTILAQKRYHGTGDNQFRGMSIDSAGNIYCVGYTYSEGLGDTSALIIKFDNNLNKVAGKVWGSTSGDNFSGVVIDSSGNIICAGYSLSGGSNSAVIVKFDSDLNIINAKVYDGAVSELFRKIKLDSNGRHICVGHTSSEGQGSYDALIMSLPPDIPSGTFVGTTLTNITLADIDLTLTDSALILEDHLAVSTASPGSIIDSAWTARLPDPLTQEKDILG